MIRRRAGSSKVQQQHWSYIITPPTFLPNFSFSEIWNYRDLIKVWVRRDITALYRQTIIGPLWYVLQPMLTTVAYIVIFSKIARLSTDNIHPIPFYLSGLILWNYFNECVISISNTFQGNANIFSKVYFPRLTLPLAQIIVTSVKFTIQFCLFLTLYFVFARPDAILPSLTRIAILPGVILMVSFLAFAVGILIASVTIKYRDLNFALAFLLQLWMYSSPVIYPISQVPKEYLVYYKLNPMATIISAFRQIFFHAEFISVSDILLSAGLIGLILFIGLFHFHKVEKTFVDTV